ncbi:MAG: sulfurtransferase TusA family protein [Candidatus Azotimanducaceae bacterium]|uniref:SirA family protein n=1 Tax=OM182 bacterium TaxID=2510334 RepID=A0A520S2J2_9GAMM|nr:SirA family protein [Gammaproteobacteria bacterium]RZO76669.1 MAG: SirA family protein [OM182 bacterium]
MLEPDEKLDTSGLTCPMPLLKAKQALNNMDSGCILEVKSTDSSSVRDFEVFSMQSGNELIESKEVDGVFSYLLRKG